MGTLNILEAAKLANCKKIISTSTSEVYGTAQKIPIDEKHKLQAQSPYAASKISADFLLESYVKSFNLPAVILRILIHLDLDSQKELLFQVLSDRY